MGAAEQQELLSTTLGCVVEFQNGGAWKEDEYVDSGVPVTRVTNCQSGTVDLSGCKYLSFSSAKRYERHRLIKGDLIVATVGSHPTQPGSVVGRTSAVPESASGSLLNQNAVRLRAKADLLDQRYLIYLASSKSFRDYIIAHARGAASQVRMSIELLREMPLLLPSLSIQQLVASFLGAYDDLIENNTRRIEILEEMARRLYEEWFVQFRFPGHEEVAFKDSALGLIPVGWTVGCLKDVITLQRGFDLPVQHRVAGAVPIISATGVGGSHVEAKVKGPGVITGRSGSIGTVMYAHGDFWPLNTTLWGAAYPLGSTLFAYYVLSSIDLKGFNVGAAVPSLNRNDIHGLPVIIPSNGIVRSFEEVVGPIHNLTEKLRRKNVNLHAQRDLLIPKLISGEIDVSDIPMPT